MEASEAASRLPLAERSSPIVELRQYTLYPGARDQFIELFDREFVETQEAAGMRVIGQFRDLGDPNRFVWIRGFADMPARERALTSFYMDGEAWRRHSEIARSMMIDSSDALLLRPARSDAAFPLPNPAQRPTLDSPLSAGLIVVTIYHPRAAAAPEFLQFFEASVLPLLSDAGARILGLFVTEHSPNNFTRLPLRENESVIIPFLGFSQLAAYHEWMTALGQNQKWRREIYPGLINRLQTRPQILRLAPTSRSQLRA